MQNNPGALVGPIFRLSDKEWKRRLREFASSMEQHVMGEVIEYWQVRKESLRQAAIIVGSLSLAFENDDSKALAKLIEPARAYLRKNSRHSPNAPGVNLVRERPESMNELKRLCMHRVARIRPSYSPGAKRTQQEIESVAIILLDNILGDPYILMSLLEPSRKTRSNASPARLAPGQNRRTKAITEVQKSVTRWLARSMPDDEVAEAAVVAALRGLGMNAKDVFSFEAKAEAGKRNKKVANRGKKTPQ